MFLSSRGHCPTCDTDTRFIAHESWLRDHFLCMNCRSIPRERALMAVIESHFQDWRDLKIHESSPIDRGASLRLRTAAGYVASQFFPDQPAGAMVGRYRCENLEALSFPDESIDLHVSQDVMEHVFRPDKVFREVARTLKPGGAHVFTVPLVNKHRSTRVRAAVSANGQVQHFAPAAYHGNPISEQGSLVTMDWGYDIGRHIFEACGLYTHRVFIDDLSRGIRAEHVDVLVTVKPPPPGAMPPGT